MAPPNDFYVLQISIHGLLRGHDLELGRDSDTGGQIQYVLDLTRALAAHPSISRVDLLTRRILDARVDPSYGVERERLAPNAAIHRIECGPRRYLRKETLWPHLDAFVDNVLRHIRKAGRLPDWIHTHYADAGYVGTRLAGILGVPLVHTGHSLGAVKRQRLIAKGVKPENIERQYKMTQRIEAEESVLDTAALVVASTRQEIEEQYGLYANFSPGHMVVIPPGVDLTRFHPPGRERERPRIADEIDRFVRDPSKPMILALSRPDPRKNIGTLIRAYAESEALRERANLVVVAGTRTRVAEMEKAPRRSWIEILMLIDDYDLYGSVAYPKQHSPEDVPDLYRLAARGGGVFVNPALTEPFGLTLIEAAACGLPIVATEDGGPADIVAHCENGVLIDPLDHADIAEKILGALRDRKRWARWSKNGAEGAHEFYSWNGHVRRYLQATEKIVRGVRARERVQAFRSRLTTADRLLVVDIDDTLIGDRKGLAALLKHLKDARVPFGFGIATGRRIQSAVEVLREWKVPVPDLFITSVGAEIYYGPRVAQDAGWRRHTDYRWDRERIVEAMREMPGLRMQPKTEQLPTKISYNVVPTRIPTVPEIRAYLRVRGLHAMVVYSHGKHLDILPMRASKGLALRYVARKWGIELERILVAGNSGNDEEMLVGNTLGVVVGNHSPELEHLREYTNVHFARGGHAWGIIEGIEFYDFLGEPRPPEDLGAVSA